MKTLKQAIQDRVRKAFAEARVVNREQTPQGNTLLLLEFQPGAQFLTGLSALNNALGTIGDGTADFYYDCEGSEEAVDRFLDEVQLDGCEFFEAYDAVKDEVLARFAAA